MGKVVLLVVVLGTIGAAVWGGRHLMSQEEEKERSENYWPARKSDFLGTIRDCICWKIAQLGQRP